MKYFFIKFIFFTSQITTQKSFITFDNMEGERQKGMENGIPKSKSQMKKEARLARLVEQRAEKKKNSVNTEADLDPTAYKKNRT